MDTQTPSPRQSARRRILVIDDDEGVRATLAIFFEDIGVDAVLAQDGNQGLSLFDAGSVDLVMTDICMPGKNGGEIVAEIRRRNRTIPIIVMSGSSRASGGELLRAAMEKGANCVIDKPFDFDSLGVALEAFLETPSGASDRGLAMPNSGQGR
ncbi:MAG TPA: response regulator [Rhodospirillales bacterium]